MPFTDNFTEASSNTNLEAHTPSGGTAWTRVDGAAGAALVLAASDDLKSNSSTNTAYTCDDQGNADQYVQFVIKRTNENFSFVCNRLTDANNLIGIRILSGAVQIFKRVTGTLTQLGANGTTTVIAGDTIRLESEGDTHRAYINGNLEITRTDSAFNTVTKQGLVIRVSSSTPWIDDFEAGVLGGPEGTKFWSVPTSAANGTVLEMVVMSSDRLTVLDLVDATATGGVFTAQCTDQGLAAGTKRFVFLHNWNESFTTLNIFGGPCVAEVIEV